MIKKFKKLPTNYDYNTDALKLGECPSVNGKDININ